MNVPFDWDAFLNEKLRGYFSGHVHGPGVTGIQISPQISSQDVRKLLEESIDGIGRKREINVEEVNGYTCLTVVVDKKPFCQVMFSQNHDPSFTEIAQFSLAA